MRRRPALRLDAAAEEAAEAEEAQEQGGGVAQEQGGGAKEQGSSQGSSHGSSISTVERGAEGEAEAEGEAAAAEAEGEAAAAEAEAGQTRGLVADEPPRATEALDGNSPPPVDAGSAPAIGPCRPAPVAVADPVGALRAAAAARGLQLESHTGRSLDETGEATARELLSMVEANMSGYSDWDAFERRREMLNPRTKLFVLRSAREGGGGAARGAAPDEGRGVGRRTRVSGGCVAEAPAAASDEGSELVGFVSFRFMTQETVRLEITTHVVYRRLLTDDGGHFS